MNLTSSLIASLAVSIYFSCLTLTVNAEGSGAEPDPLASMSQIEDLKDGTSLGAADISRARPLKFNAIALLKDFEGWRPAHYNDSSNYCTIGYGHLIALESCESINLGRFARPITLEEGDSLLSSDLVSARVAVTSLLSPGIDVNDDQFGALVVFTFNLGKSRLRDSTLLKLVNEGSFDAAAQQFSRWAGAKNKKTGKIERVEGLVTRRACEAALFRGEIKGANFDRSDCAPLGITAQSAVMIDVAKGE